MTIDFFELDTREELLRGRAQAIAGYYLLWRQKEERTALEERLRKDLLGAGVPHAGCTRAFDALCQRDAEEAKRQFEAAADYLHSQS